MVLLRCAMNWVGAVSYTHLDVYKRQVVISVACAYVAPQAAGESSVLEGATQEQTALPAMPGASKDAAAGAQKAIPAAGADAQKAAPVVPTSPAK